MTRVGGNFFEDFSPGQKIIHATPKTVTEGDIALYGALYGSRFALSSSHAFAEAVGYDRPPVDDLLVFHIVFGKTVPDISVNAVANLGYADCRFLAPVHAGDTLSAETEIIGVKQTSSGKTGIVWVRSSGFNQHGEMVVTFARWVMVNKRDPAAAAPEPMTPDLPAAVAADALATAVPAIDLSAWNDALSGSSRRFEDYAPGERIDHVDGMTVEEAEHMLATRLYQNTARVHFNQFEQQHSRFGRRLIYGGHVISLARALSFNGLANAFHIAAINAGRHVAPLFAGDTVFAWSEVIDTAELAGRDDIAALRVRTIACKDRPCVDFPEPGDDGDADGVILDLDYWAAIPRRA